MNNTLSFPGIRCVQAMNEPNEPATDPVVGTQARGGKLLDSHRVMGNDPNLINMFYQQYVNCNKKDISIPKKYRELIVMAVGIATSTETTMKVHGKLALENGATIDEIFEVIRILFFTCGVTKLLPALETLGDLFEAIDLEEK